MSRLHLALVTPLLVLAPLSAWAQNVEDGRDVFGPCAACHGASGEGGKGGEYPRLAGQPATFLVASLKQFQERRRNSLPMFPYTEPRELSERDMQDVAAYLEAIQLPAKVPEFKDTDSALDRLLKMERVLVVPRVEGDAAKGRATFLELCADCHGKNGRGRASRDAPALTGQYPNYLLRQMEAFKKGARGTGKDDAMAGQLDDLSPTELRDVLAWLTAIQDQDEGDAASGKGAAPADKAR